MHVGALSSSVPAPVARGGYNPDLLNTPAGAGQAQAGVSAATGVAYATGAVTVGRTDLVSDGFGDPWGLDWSWSSGAGYSDGIARVRGDRSGDAHLVQVNGNNSLGCW